MNRLDKQDWIILALAGWLILRNIPDLIKMIESKSPYHDEIRNPGVNLGPTWGRR